MGAQCNIKIPIMGQTTDNGNGKTFSPILKFVTKNPSTSLVVIRPLISTRTVTYRNTLIVIVMPKPIRTVSVFVRSEISNSIRTKRDLHLIYKAKI